MKRLIFLGILTFFGVLFATFPARVAYNWAAPAELRLSGIAGSIWNGSATEGIAGALMYETSPGNSILCPCCPGRSVSRPAAILGPAR